MKAKTILIASCLAAPFILKAQGQKRIYGAVSDDKNETLPGATVSLLNTKDSSLLKAAITDINGGYEIMATFSDTCLLSYTNIGFETKYIRQATPEGSNEYHVPDIKLEPQTGRLQDVVVTARKPTIDVRADKVVFNVEGSINATGSNALELLQKSPGVMVDNNENISLKGRSGIRIYIDGKMTQLDTKDLAAYLKSMSSSDIEAIEMITNPGAKYDASGNAGIINIRLKKNRKFGTNGSADMSIGRGINTKGNAGGSLNYRNEKINLFSTVSGYAANNQSDLHLYRLQSDTIFDQHTIMRNKWNTANIKAGGDYFLNDKNTIGVMVISNFSTGRFRSDGHTDIYSQNSGDYLKTLQSSNNAPSDRTNADFNVNYHYVDTNGTEIGFDADYGLFRSNTTSFQPNYYYDPGQTLMYRVINGNHTPTNINIYTAKLDLEHKLWKGKLGYGAKYAYVKTDNTFNFYNYFTDEPVMDMNLSNRFVYTENVNAAYLNYNRTFTKWSLQAGLRLEQTNSEGKLTRADGTFQEDNNVKRHYLNLFPSGAVSYNLNESNTVGFNYSRRIDRPNYRDLNPFENKLDQLTYEKGNAFLKPQYTNNFELSYTFKSMINTSIGYAHVRDYAVTVTDTVNGNATYVQTQNIATQRIYSFNISSPLPIRKWWNGYINFWYNYQALDGNYNGAPMQVTASMFGGYMQHTFTLGKGFTAELSGWYSSKGLEHTWQRNALGSVDVGLQKRFWDDKASLKLAVSDLFNTIQFNGGSGYGGANLKINQNNETRVVRLSFSYRFGNNQVKAARQRKTALDSEGKRI